MIPWIPEIVKCLTPAATLILFNLCIDFGARFWRFSLIKWLDEGAQALSVHLDNLVDRAIATNDETNGDDLKICSLFDVVEILLDSGWVTHSLVILHALQAVIWVQIKSFN